MIFNDIKWYYIVLNDHNDIRLIGIIILPFYDGTSNKTVLNHHE